MGREIRILLALLGLLAGVFLGVVSLKLFVPRPPAGTGPDVHADIASVEAQDLVAPPELAPPPVRRAAEPGDAYAERTSRFTAAAGPSLDQPAFDQPALDQPALDQPAHDQPALDEHDPFVRQAAFELPEASPAEPPEDLLPPASPTEPGTPPLDPEPAVPAAELSARAEADFPPVAPPAPLLPPVMVEPTGLSPGPPSATPLGDAYVAQPGDSWWSVAERAYGDGRLYRALFAWNRAIDPRVSLAPGTRLAIPPAAQLGAAWPALLPRGR